MLLYLLGLAGEKNNKYCEHRFYQEMKPWLARDPGHQGIELGPAHVQDESRRKYIDYKKPGEDGSKNRKN